MADAVCTIGEMRHRVSIQRPVVTVNALGQEDTAWMTLASRYAARVRQTGSRELWRAQQVQPDISFEITMYWLAGVESKFRVIWHDGETNRTLQIEMPPINPDGRKRWMTMFCKEAN